MTYMLHIYIYIYAVYMCTYTYIYIYIYIAGAPGRRPTTSFRGRLTLEVSFTSLFVPLRACIRLPVFLRGHCLLIYLVCNITYARRFNAAFHLQAAILLEAPTARGRPIVQRGIAGNP